MLIPFQPDWRVACGSCRHFRHVPLGEAAPEYRWFFADDGDMWCEEVKA